MKLETIVIFLGMVINVVGTILWIKIHQSGIYSGWWVIGFMILCGLSALILTSKFIKNLYSQIVGR